MNRSAMDYLVAWKDSKRRKPLVLRGAKQFGKSYLVKAFASRYMDNLVEINFEETPTVLNLFTDKSPGKIVPRLELQMGTKIVPGQTRRLCRDHAPEYALKKKRNQVLL